MKKYFEILSICIIGIFLLGLTIFNVDAKECQIINRQNEYYDKELGAKVVSFTINGNGTINYLTRNEIESLENTSTMINKQNKNDQYKPYSSDLTWYVFKQKSGPIFYKGEMVKVTPDLEGSPAGSSISYQVGASVSAQFSFGYDI